MRTRRAFLRAAGAALVACRTLPRSRAPDLLLVNGNIVTVDPRRPRASAVAISDGRFAFVGDTADALAFAGAGTRRIDLGGKTVVPGFIDAHSHPAEAGLLHLKRVDCDLRSIAAITTALAARAAKTPAGEWVLGFKYDDTKTEDRRFLTRDDLDTAVPKHPVLISHRGGHTCYVNSLALARASVGEQTPDPPGGRFDRDANGRLTGRVLENAVAAFDAVVPDDATRDDRRAGVALISRMLARAGITSAHDAWGSPEILQSYRDARAAGELVTRVYCFMHASHFDKLHGSRTGDGDEWIRLGGIKAVCDGSISERTARLSKPYVGRPNDYGILVADADELYPIVRRAHAAGWQVGIHANGDVGIDRVLTVYERVQRELPRRDPRFRIEHCTVVDDRLIERIRKLGAIPTPFASYVYFHGEKMAEYGQDRLGSMFALRSFLDAGIPAAPGSDYPPGPFEPMMALQSSVTRTDLHGTVWGARQRITVEEAIRAQTLHGAHASFEEHAKGSIEVGKLADLVVLGRDPLRADPMTLVTIPIERTMVGGRWVFEA